MWTRSLYSNSLFKKWPKKGLVGHETFCFKGESPNCTGILSGLNKLQAVFLVLEKMSLGKMPKNTITCDKCRTLILRSFPWIFKQKLKRDCIWLLWCNWLLWSHSISIPLTGEFLYAYWLKASLIIQLAGLTVSSLSN